MNSLPPLRPQCSEFWTSVKRISTYIPVPCAKVDLWSIPWPGYDTDVDTESEKDELEKEDVIAPPLNWDEEENEDDLFPPDEGFPISDLHDVGHLDLDSQEKGHHRRNIVGSDH